VEPYLLKSGLVVRTSQGRRATEAAYQHLDISMAGPSGPGALFENKP
jgi:Holliday junction resolvasome RuvABC ATP-dependent DNA helicase subunit